MRAEEASPTRDELLAMAYVDDELDAATRRAFEARLSSEPDLAREVVDLQGLALLARHAAPPEPMDHEWARLERELVQRGGSRLAWSVLVVSALGLGGWLLFEVVRSPLELVPKALILALAGSLVLLLALSVRARLRTLRYDPYTKVQR